MIFKVFTAVLFFSLFISLSAQNSKASKLQNYYETFQYTKVISKADSIINSKIAVEKDELLRIYTLKAASHFTLGEMVNSRKTFIEILKIDDSFILDNTLFSPKLHEYFNSIKSEFKDIMDLKNQSENEDPINDSFISRNSSLTGSAVVKSLLLPGFGHFDFNNDSKGWVLSIVSSLTLGSMIYFIADTYSKEGKYLTEKDPLLLESAYKNYNTAYKTRNALIFAYAAVWLYSQIDLLFFSGGLRSDYYSKIQIIPNHTFPTQDLKISFTIGF